MRNGMAKPLIIPLFLLHQGCPHRCIFCNEGKAVGGGQPAITGEYLKATVAAYLKNGRRKDRGPVQIAFYGGNFTGIETARQRELLEMAGQFVGEGLVDGIRISTRPDYIDAAGLELLKEFHVQTVELGAQSLVDSVLQCSRRGHTADDVRQALALLKGRGFETGLHLMVGLPGDSPESFAATVRETVALQPHMVRLHPTLVFADTGLEAAWKRGDYRPLSMAGAIAACKYALGEFTGAGIPVIRLGLQTTPEMEKPGSIVAGPYHPSFRCLVEEAVFRDLVYRLLAGQDSAGREVTFFLSPRDISTFRGQNNRNIKAIKEQYALADLTLSIDPDQPRGGLKMTMNKD